MTKTKNTSDTTSNGVDKSKGATGATGEDPNMPDAAQQSPLVDPEIAKKIAQLRSSLRENFGKAVMAMMMVPRYRAQNLADLQHIVLDPMLQDRIAIAYPGKTEKTPEPDMSGFAIWASVSEEVDARIREQIANGVFPIRLKSNEWSSGDINWLLDVIAADRATIATVIANFRQVVKEGELRLHPLITRLVDRETLEKIGARKASDAKSDS